MSLQAEPLLIVGATARAAAGSARRAAFEPIAIDRFGDVDLQTCCQSVRLASFPDGLVAALEALPHAPWIYTGPLENRRALVGRLGQLRPLYGNGPLTLGAIRDPFAVARVLKEGGIATPAVARPRDIVADRPPAPKTWLEKRVFSGGGLGVRIWDPSMPAVPDSYLQEFIPGQPFSAIYLMTAGRSQFVGATYQWTGCEWSGGSGFHYSGSIGPVEVAGRRLQDLRTLGDKLAANFDLTGLVNVDAILHEGSVWPVEINPRYSASVEVLELAGRPLLRHHVRACKDRQLEEVGLPQSNRKYGKAVIYARREVVVQDDLVEFANRESLQLADIPEVGNTIHRGHPVLTVLADHPNLDGVIPKIRAAVQRVQRKLGC